LRTLANQLRPTELIDVKAVSDTVKTFVFEDEKCGKARPGQFLMLWVPRVDEIPLSILDVESKNRVSVAVKNVGEASGALHCKKPGEIIGVRGPFGNHFTVYGPRLLMVGGGTGVAPLLFLAKRFVPREVAVTFVLGARTKDELLFSNELKRLKKRQFTVVYSTEDGSCGVPGLCTQPVEDLLGEGGFDAVYTCGPEKMILKVFALAERHKVPFQASLERLMRCAIGVCGSCAFGGYTVCRDGPVFSSRQLKQVAKEFGVFKRDMTGKKVPLD
jgi:dihydroorotate dehydrogenase electron transfer subunit